MADNSLQGGTDTIRDLARQAGTVKTQTFQLDLGGASANAEVLISAGQKAMALSMPVVIANDQPPIPTSNPVNASFSATFTAADAVVGAPVGDGTLVSGASTAGSVISLVIPDGYVGWTLLLKNWANGTVYTEASTNSTNGTDGDWVEVKGRRTGTAPGTESVVYAMVASGYYRGNGAGFKYIRARFFGGTTFPTAAWTLSTGSGASFLNSGIPGGTSLIGYTEGTAGALLARDGTDITTPTAMPAGGLGIRGWLSAIWTKLNGTLGVTGTFWQATQPVSMATNTPDVTDRSARLLGTIANTTFATTNAGTFAVQAASTLAAETTKVIGTVNLSAGQTIAAVSATTPAPSTTTAATLSSAANTNATSVKASAGNLYAVVASNIGAAAAFLKLFNLATAPTVGTSVPFLTIPIAASGVVSIPFGAQGMRMATGIAFAITNLAADTDTTAVAAAQVKVAIAYI